jgi:hypothetical protein
MPFNKWLLFFLFFFSLHAQQVWKFQNQKGKEVKFKVQKPTILILKNTKNCIKCFDVIYFYLDSVFKGTDIYFLINCDRRQAIGEYHQMYRLCMTKNILFEFRPEEGVTEDMFLLNIYKKGGVFERCNIEVTPSVAVLRDDKIKCIPFSQFYHQGHFDRESLSISIKEAIEKN